MITLIKGTEAACGTNAAGASTFGSSTAVRLVNTTGTARLVTVIDEVGGSTTIGTFTLLGNTKEVVEKKSTQAIFAAKIASVGFFSTTSTALPGNVKVPIVVDPPTSSITVTNLAVPLLLIIRTTVAFPNVEAFAAFWPHAA